MDPIKLHRPRTTPFVANSRSARCKIREIQHDCHLEIAVLRIVLWFEIKRVLNKPAGVEIGCPPFSSLPGECSTKSALDRIGRYPPKICVPAGHPPPDSM